MLKIMLLLDNPGGVRSGYFNIDPFAPLDDVHGRSRGDVADLRSLVDMASADEIVALDILDYFSPQDAARVVSQWAMHLRHGGELTVSVTDFDELARQSLLGKITLSEVNKRLYGNDSPEKKWDRKKLAANTESLTHLLKSSGLTIVRGSRQDMKVILTAKRP